MTFAVIFIQKDPNMANMFSLFSEDAPKSTSNNIDKQHIVHFIPLPAFLPPTTPPIDILTNI